MSKETDLGSTVMWTAISFGSLFCWCVILPYLSKVISAICDPALPPPLVPMAEIDIPATASAPVTLLVPASTERQPSPNPSPEQQQVSVFCPDAKVIRTPSSESLSLELPVAREESHMFTEDKETDDYDDCPRARAQNIFVMQVVSRLGD